MINVPKAPQSRNQKTFKKISGKWGQLFLYGFEKEEISLTALNLHSTELNDIIKIQFIQVDYGIVNVNASLSCEINDGVLASIETLLSKRVGNKIMFKFSVSNDFKFNKRGKTPLIINLIK